MRGVRHLLKATVVRLRQATLALNSIYQFDHQTCR